MSEIWDAYDKDRNLLLGKSIKRDTFSTDDDYHLVVEVLLLHEEDNSVLFMKRSPEKPSFPDYYEATAGGSALQGESSEQAVRRELLEETGLTVSRLQLFYQTTEDKYHMHFDKYIGWTKESKEAISYQEGETVGHVWVKPRDLKTFLKKEKIVPSQIEELKILFNLDAIQKKRNRPITRYIEKGSKVLSTLEPFSIYLVIGRLHYTLLDKNL